MSDSSWWSADPVSKSSGTSASNWWASDPVKGAKTSANATPDQGMSWGDVGKGAIENLPSSALRFGEDVAQPFIHPIDTATGVKNIGEGVLEKTGMISGTEHEKYADAIGKFFKDRYGGMDEIKHTLATDPVGVAADLSTFLTGGDTLAARAPGIIGRAGEAAADVGRAVDPVRAAGKVAKGVGRVASETIGGIGTHTGGESLRLAARSGYEGGAAGKTFRENMRGSASMEDVVAEARGAVSQMRQQRGSAYRQGMMAHVASDPTVLNFSKIDQAVQDAGGIKKYKGQSISPSTEAIHAKMEEVVDEWKNLDPKEFHTVEGLDALKQKLGDVRDATQHGTPERLAADRIYQAVRKTITEQAPEYARVMRGYEKASTQIKEIERALSLNQNASVDTALRKLQSVLRDNVNSNYGNRKVLADYLVHSGAPHLMEALAGQALKPWTARGLGKLGWQLAAEIGLASAAPHAAIGVAAGLPFMSPRVMGETAHAGGRLARRIPEGTGRAAFQVGRESQLGNDDDVKIIPDGP